GSDTFCSKVRVKLDTGAARGGGGGCSKTTLPIGGDTRRLCALPPPAAKIIALSSRKFRPFALRRRGDAARGGSGAAVFLLQEDGVPSVCSRPRGATPPARPLLPLPLPAPLPAPPPLATRLLRSLLGPRFQPRADARCCSCALTLTLTQGQQQRGRGRSCMDGYGERSGTFGGSSGQDPRRTHLPVSRGSGRKVRKTRKYDIITTPAERIEMAPLNEENEDEEDSTLFDIKYRWEREPRSRAKRGRRKKKAGA
uniref:Repulsive guidance molecule BMP co-receptor a n=2 Tax=Scleropages formosus TaxID=113540 RepID=A0A8C9SU76_SCLFO